MTAINKAALPTEGTPSGGHRGLGFEAKKITENSAQNSSGNQEPVGRHQDA